MQPELDLESFIEEHDFLTWTAGPSTSQPNNPITSLHALRSFVDVTIVNDFTSIEHLRQHLSELDLLNRERLRPSWDSYFMVSLLLPPGASFTNSMRVFGVSGRNAFELYETKSWGDTRQEQPCHVHWVRIIPTLCCHCYNRRIRLGITALREV